MFPWTVPSASRLEPSNTDTRITAGQRFQCLDCGRQFVENPTRQPIDETTRNLVDQLLLERLALAAITRVTNVSERWLQMYVNQKYYQTSQQVQVTRKNLVGWPFNKGEIWSFVGSKDNKQWIWLAIDVDTREIVGVYVGDRTRQSASML